MNRWDPFDIGAVAIMVGMAAMMVGLGLAIILDAWRCGL